MVIQTSRFEGKSIVLDEAKIMKKLIVCTDYPSVNDQIINESNGLVVPLSSEGVANGIIEDFRIVSHNETKAVTKTALTKIPYEIVKEQSVNVDIVSSATETSAAILQAARDCIRQAGGNPNDYN